MTTLAQVGLPEARVYRSHHRDLAQLLADTSGMVVDAVIVDAPYSAKTHAGHDDGTECSDLGSGWTRANGCVETKIRRRRRRLQYESWGEAEVKEFVSAWAPRNRGWFVSLTDDVLFPIWRQAFADAGLTTFQDVPAVITGMTVRLSGDGPSSWAIHCCVARPKALSKWGTLPGAYVVPAARQMVVGGKPLDLMRAIVRDYSRPGDLVCDPCCGAGTTLVAARLEGRGSIGCDIDAAHAQEASAALSGLRRHGDRQFSMFHDAEK